MDKGVLGQLNLPVMLHRQAMVLRVATHRVKLVMANSNLKLTATIQPVTFVFTNVIIFNNVISKILQAVPMVRTVGRRPLNNLTTMHSHKRTRRGMGMVQQQRTPLDMLTIKHRLRRRLITKDNKDINHTHDN